MTGEGHGGKSSQRLVIFCFLLTWVLATGVCSFGILIELYTCDLCSS